MHYHRMSTARTAYMPAKAWRALTACGGWMRMSFVGASALAAGLALAVRGAADVPAVAALVAGGGFVAVFSWRRARAILERADAWDARASGAPRTAEQRVILPRFGLRRSAIQGME